MASNFATLSAVQAGRSANTRSHLILLTTEHMFKNAGTVATAKHPCDIAEYAPVAILFEGTPASAPWVVERRQHILALFIVSMADKMNHVRSGPPWITNEPDSL